MSLPATLEDVAAWAARLRDQRTTELGRGIVDCAEKVARTFFTCDDPQYVAQLGNTLDKLLRALIQADRGDEAEEIRELRRRADRQETTAGRLKGMH
jgi:hypothetical protein